MRKLILTACFAMTHCIVFANHQLVKLRTEQDINAFVNQMTIEEKVGQMTELVIDVIGHWEEGNFVLDNDKLERALIKYKVGSILNAPGPVAQTPEWWYKTICTINEYSIRGCGIPCVYGLDQNHGTTYTLGGTMFPQNINIGASFNPELAYKGATITAYETRASNCPWTYSPTVDLSRDPRWPRVWENFGEDCLVNAVMGKTMIEGFQGKEKNLDRYHIGTSVKHFMAYGIARTGKDRTPSYVPEFELREKHFAPFKACVEAGATSVMVNSGSVNGIPMHINAKYLTQWLKEETGWDGMLVTDWADIDNLWKREMVAANKKDAICMAINAGIDMAMEPYDLSFCDLLIELVHEGRVSMERIDDAVRRILRMKMRMGLFEHPNTNPKDYPEFGSTAHRKAALDAAVETMILLKNQNNLLPLQQGKHILVTGPNANSMRCLNGGWSYTWQGKDVDKYASDKNTILEAMQQRFGNANIIYEPGVTYNNEGQYWEENEPQIAKAVAAAQKADIILACIGENSYTETPGNLDDLALSANQRQLVKELAATGKPIILIINGGRPRLISDIEPLASAVVDILLPGNEGGDALARLLAGDENFSGRMPYTYPRHSASLTTYDYRVSEETGTMEGVYDYNAQVNVQWPFGYGLSYTTFDYSNLRVDKSEFRNGDILTVNVDVKNTGNRIGKESVLLFSRDMIASIVPESRRLRAFQKIELKPGQQQTVTFRLPASDLAFVGTDGKWHLEPGTFKLQIGNQHCEVICIEAANRNNDIRTTGVNM
jgi:beta-glucosidase